MDNITHSLIGVTLAHAWRGRAKADSGKTAALSVDATVAISVVASNLADSDFLIRFFSVDPKLTYLLHHRGFTHTLLFLPVIAALAAVFGAWFGRAKLKSWRERWNAFALAALAVALHFGADFWNDYGIHPFSPCSNRWFYGDFVFILEPLLWVSLLPLAFFEAKRIFWKGLWAVVGVGVIALAWTSPFATWPVSLWITAWAVIAFAVQKRVRGIKFGVVALVLVLGLFKIESNQARSQLQAHLASHASDERILDIALAPAPANPFCWRFVSASEGVRESYRARLGVLSLSEKLFEPERCWGRMGGAERTAPLIPVELPVGPGMLWVGEFRGSFSEMKSLAARSCRFSAYLGYARMPFWLREPGSDRWIGGDLRYDREKGLGFAEHEFSARDTCTGLLPTW